jgi:hypothetical protein
MLTRVVLLTVFLMSSSGLLWAQCCTDTEIRAWQQAYKEDFLKDKRSPLTAADTGKIRFFPISRAHFNARLKRTPNSKPVQMATHSGKVKTFKPYGVLKLWTDKGVIDLRPPALIIKRKLVLYESVDHPDDTTLFLPFYDETNGKETYGGGRYMDIPKSLFKNTNTVWGAIDFNKAYNPWCVFKEGYSCPIPPKENTLHVRMDVGEMLPADYRKD